MFWNEDHFVVHCQDERGLFTSAATAFTTDVAFDSDDPGTLAAPRGIRHRRKDGMPTAGDPRRRLDMTGRVLHPDGGTAFATEVGTANRSHGLPVWMGPHDFDHDGQIDMMFTTIEIGAIKTIGMIIGTLLTGSVSLKLELYRMVEGSYPRKPSATRTIKTISHGKSGERAAIFPSVLFGDVNGDGRSDLLVQKGRKELRVFLGVPGKKLFARRPQRVAVAIPNEEYTSLVDLNRDGKQDILMHNTSTTESHRVTILIAR